MWTRLAGLSGAAAVGAGAVGAHALPKELGASYRDIYKTGANYHLIHSCALATSALALSGRKRNLTCALFASGMLLFSGSCYTVALKGERKPYSYPAPVGGFLLIGGWLVLGLMP